MASKFQSYVEYSFAPDADDNLVEFEREIFFIDGVEVSREEYKAAALEWAGPDCLDDMPCSAGRALREATKA